MSGIKYPKYISSQMILLSDGTLKSSEIFIPDNIPPLAKVTQLFLPHINERLPRRALAVTTSNQLGVISINGNMMSFYLLKTNVPIIDVEVLESGYTTAFVLDCDHNVHVIQDENLIRDCVKFETDVCAKDIVSLNQAFRSMLLAELKTGQLLGLFLDLDKSVTVLENPFQDVIGSKIKRVGIRPDSGAQHCITIIDENGLNYRVNRRRAEQLPTIPHIVDSYSLFGFYIVGCGELPELNLVINKFGELFKIIRKDNFEHEIIKIDAPQNSDPKFTEFIHFKFSGYEVHLLDDMGNIFKYTDKETRVVDISVKLHEKRWTSTKRANW